MKVRPAHRWVANAVPLSVLDDPMAESLAVLGTDGARSLGNVLQALQDLRALSTRKRQKFYDKYRWVISDQGRIFKPKTPKGEQKEALARVLAWYNDHDRQQVFHLYGAAGTGKSTLGVSVDLAVPGKVLWVAPTGKAAQNLRTKGLQAQTIHSTIYVPQQDEHTGQITYNKRHTVDASLLAVDEAMMVGAKVGQDLLSFGVPILAIADPAQLLPVDDQPLFLTQEPEAMLETIHRNARDNPIVWAAHRIRKGKDVPYGSYVHESGSIRVRDRAWLDSKLDKMLLRFSRPGSTILCGTNKTRQAFNNRIRKLKGYAGKPRPGELLICLKNNLPFVNGGLWRVLYCSDPWTIQASYTTKNHNGMIVRRPSVWSGAPGDLDKQGRPVLVDVCELLLVSADIAGDPVRAVVPWAPLVEDKEIHWKQAAGMTNFTWGYALTVHKAQGSEFQDVLLIDESWAFGDQQLHHRYTGYTRARENLVVIK